jgi:hypothetical protein
MKTYALIVSAILLLSAAAFSQEKTNDEINRQIRSTGVDHVNVSFDASSNMSKLMAVSENFSNRDADSAGVLAMNFAMGFFYTGQSLKSSPESVHFSFWVLTKKPRFAESHHLTVDLDGRTLDLGDARYAAKPAQNMEYLNFELSRSDLTAIGSGKNVTFHIGARTFTASAAQINSIKAVAKIIGNNDLH